MIRIRDRRGGGGGDLVDVVGEREEGIGRERDTLPECDVSDVFDVLVLMCGLTCVCVYFEVCFAIFVSSVQTSGVFSQR